MCQSREEVAGSLVLDLNEEATCAEPTETDDRRNVFSIVQPVNKKYVFSSPCDTLNVAVT